MKKIMNHKSTSNLDSLDNITTKNRKLSDKVDLKKNFIINQMKLKKSNQDIELEQRKSYYSTIRINK